MTVEYGFYNSVNGDRTYNAEQMSRLFEGLFHDGVFEDIGDKLNIDVSTGMGVTVKTGRAWFNNKWIKVDESFRLPIDDAHVAYGRIDIVAIEVNNEISTRTCTIKVIKGTPSSSPVAPTLTNVGDIHQYPLAHIAIAAGVTSILIGNITNKVGTVDCPYVKGILRNVDTVVIDEQIATLQQLIANNAAGVVYGTATIDSNGDYSVTLNPAPISYNTGYTFLCKFNKSNPTSYTRINVNGLGMKYIKINGTESIMLNMIKSDKYYTLIFDGTNIQILEFTDAVRSLGFGQSSYLYVDQTSGNDITGDGSSSFPYGSIWRALDSLPKFLNGANTAINIAAGNYSVPLNITNFVGGHIIFNKWGAGPVNITGQCAISDCDSVTIYQLNFTRTNGTGIDIDRCKNVRIQDCVVTGSASSYDGISVDDVNNCTISTCTISNHLVAINTYHSTVNSLSNSGSNNSIGLNCQGSTIMKSGTQPSGSTAESVSGGGVIR